MKCQRCGAPVDEGVKVCANCKRAALGPVAPGPVAPGGQNEMRFIMPVGTSGWAVAAGYAGLFAFTCVLAPLAILFGLLAVRDLQRHADKRGWGRTIFGLVTGTLGTLVLLFFIVAAIIERQG